MPGLLNHLTGTLEQIDCQAVQQEENESLLKTIKMPRRMGQITERLPAPQYEAKKNDKLLEVEVKDFSSVSSSSPNSNGGTKSRAGL